MHFESNAMQSTATASSVLSSYKCKYGKCMHRSHAFDVLAHSRRVLSTILILVMYIQESPLSTVLILVMIVDCADVCLVQGHCTKSQTLVILYYVEVFMECYN